MLTNPSAVTLDFATATRFQAAILSLRTELNNIGWSKAKGATKAASEIRQLLRHEVVSRTEFPISACTRDMGRNDYTACMVTNASWIPMLLEWVERAERFLGECPQFPRQSWYSADGWLIIKQ